MTYNPKVHFIPAKPPKLEKRVGIYCRVSTNDTEQLNSLTMMSPSRFPVSECSAWGMKKPLNPSRNLTQCSMML